MVGYPIPTTCGSGAFCEPRAGILFVRPICMLLIFKRGFKVLISQVYDPSDPHIETDVQFGVTRALVGDFIRHDTRAPSWTAVSRRRGTRSTMST